MTTLRTRRKDTGTEVEVLDVAANDYVFVAPSGRPEEGVLLPAHELDPDPWDLILQHGFTPWTDRLLPRVAPRKRTRRRKAQRRASKRRR